VAQEEKLLGSRCTDADADAHTDAHAAHSMLLQPESSNQISALTWRWVEALLYAVALSAAQPWAGCGPHTACAEWLGHSVAVAVAGVTQPKAAVCAGAGLGH
jgi:hypothetical protein